MIKHLFRNPQTQFVFSFTGLFGLSILLASWVNGEQWWFYYVIGFFPFVGFILTSFVEYLIKNKRQ